VPLAPGVFSAMGLLVSDLKRDHVHTHVSDLQTASAAQIQARFEQMEATAMEELSGEGIAAGLITCDRALDLRYSIQKYELPVPVAAGALSDSQKPEWREQFDQRHEQTFGTRATDQSVEIVSYRLTASVKLPKPDLPVYPAGAADPSTALKGRREAHFGAAGWADTPVYDRMQLATGHRFAGPTIIEQPDCTIVVHPGQHAWVDSFKNIIIETGGGQV
ncbi:MAG: hydantoinase/oxoprolinase family protein, partial [Chloroflexota bacterium]